MRRSGRGHSPVEGAPIFGAVVVALLVLFVEGCAVVPANRRARLADPMMSITGDALEKHQRRKLFTSREAAAGGEGAPAGGGCGCQ